jgi:hypothetical protein
MVVAERPSALLETDGVVWDKILTVVAMANSFFKGRRIKDEG